MLEKIKQFDLWLIEAVFEKILHGFQRWTAVTNFSLAKACAFILFLVMAASRSWVLIAMAAVTGFGMHFAATFSERMYYRYVFSGSKNLLKVAPMSCAMRLSTLFTGFLVLYLERDIRVFVIALFGYLVSCDPLPPQQSKLW